MYFMFTILSILLILSKLSRVLVLRDRDEADRLDDGLAALGKVQVDKRVERGAKRGVAVGVEEERAGERVTAIAEPGLGLQLDVANRGDPRPESPRGCSGAAVPSRRTRRLDGLT